MGNPRIELFDSRGKFVMPSADQISELDEATQARFRAVQEAAPELEAATDNREAAEQSRDALYAERNAIDKQLRELPRMTREQLVKQHIASERARQ
jgi:hypothetical protein